MESSGSITLYYDCISPFTFFAFTVLQRYEKIWNMQIILKPVLLGGVMAATKNTPPLVRPHAKVNARFFQQDMARNYPFFAIENMQ